MLRAKDDVLGLMAQLAKVEGDADRQLDLLKALSLVRMTFDLLVATKVGNTVKPLRKAPHAGLADAAKNLMADWRVTVDNHNAKVSTRIVRVFLWLGIHHHLVEIERSVVNGFSQIIVCPCNLRLVALKALQSSMRHQSS